LEYSAGGGVSGGGRGKAKGTTTEQWGRNPVVRATYVSKVIA
jgi:hypothetical protein